MILETRDTLRLQNNKWASCAVYRQLACDTPCLQQNKEAEPEATSCAVYRQLVFPKAPPQVGMHEGEPFPPYAGYNGSLIPPSPMHPHGRVPPPPRDGLPAPPPSPHYAPTCTSATSSA